MMAIAPLRPSDLALKNDFNKDFDLLFDPTHDTMLEDPFEQFMVTDLWEISDSSSAQALYQTATTTTLSMDDLEDLGVLPPPPPSSSLSAPTLSSTSSSSPSHHHPHHRPTSLKRQRSLSAQRSYPIGSGPGDRATPATTAALCCSPTLASMASMAQRTRPGARAPTARPGDGDPLDLDVAAAAAAAVAPAESCPPSSHGASPTSAQAHIAAPLNPTASPPSTPLSPPPRKRTKISGGDGAYDKESSSPAAGRRSPHARRRSHDQKGRSPNMMANPFYQVTPGSTPFNLHLPNGYGLPLSPPPSTKLSSEEQDHKRMMVANSSFSPGAQDSFLDYNLSPQSLNGAVNHRSNFSSPVTNPQLAQASTAAAHQRSASGNIDYSIPSYGNESLASPGSSMPPWMPRTAPPQVLSFGSAYNGFQNSPMQPWWANGGSSNPSPPLQYGNQSNQNALVSIPTTDGWSDNDFANSGLMIHGLPQSNQHDFMSSLADDGSEEYVPSSSPLYAHPMPLHQGEWTGPSPFAPHGMQFAPQRNSSHTPPPSSMDNAANPRARRGSTKTNARKVTKSKSPSRQSTSPGASSAVDFVNFTPSDSRKILTGVAPSGSSKTRARREKEAMERRRRLSQAAIKAIQEAGGDVNQLQREGLLM